MLLKSTEGHPEEKDGTTDESLDRLDVIDEDKATVEAECPGVVSCADSAAPSARDSVVLVGERKCASVREEMI